MDDFNKIFKDALDGHEVPFDASAWESLSGKLSPLEDAVRDAVKDHEAPYNPKAWSNIKGQIGGNNTLLKWTLGSAAAIGLIITSVIVFNTSTERNSFVENTINEKKLNTPFNLERNESPLNSVEIEHNPTINNSNEDNETVLENIANIQESINSNTPENGLLDSDTNDGNLPPQDINNGDETPTLNNDASSINDITVVPLNNVPSSEPRYNANFSVSASEVCLTEVVLFNAKEFRNDLNYEWSFGDNATSTKANPIHEFTKSGNFVVTLTVSNLQGESLAEEQHQIKVNATPTSNFKWNKENDAIPTIIFENVDSENVSNVIWKVNQKPISDKNEMEYTFRTKGDYIVSLETTNENGCSTITEKEIAINNNYNLFAPKAFSPNGDGINDSFIPRALEIMNTEFIMTIYDQSGQMAYQTNNVSAPWNGFNVGSNVQEVDGAFIWVVQLKNGNGTYETYKGQVFISKN